MLIRTCSPFWFDFASTEYPQRLAPHCSIRTLPSFSSVSHMPSGEFADWAAVVGGAGAWFWIGADAGAVVATTGAGSGRMAGSGRTASSGRMAGSGRLAGAASCCGAGVLTESCVEEMVSVDGALLSVAVSVAVEGSGQVLTTARPRRIC